MSDLGERPKDDRGSRQLSNQPPVRRKAAMVTSEALETKTQRRKRTRKLTEKGQKLTLLGNSRSVMRNGNLWKSSSVESLQDVMARIIKASVVVGTGFKDIRHMSIPDHDTRHRVDNCEAVPKKMKILVKHHFEGTKQLESAWSDKDL